MFLLCLFLTCSLLERQSLHWQFLWKGSRDGEISVKYEEADHTACKKFVLRLGWWNSRKRCWGKLELTHICRWLHALTHERLPLGVGQPHLKTLKSVSVFEQWNSVRANELRPSLRSVAVCQSQRDRAAKLASLWAAFAHWRNYAWGTSQWLSIRTASWSECRQISAEMKNLVVRFAWAPFECLPNTPIRLGLGSEFTRNQLAPLTNEMHASCLSQKRIPLFLISFLFTS